MVSRVLVARRPGACAACGIAFGVGATISWDRASRTACCPSCPHPATEPLTRAEFAGRRADRIARYEGYAANARARSDAADRARRAITDNIALGQPILVGHHSERRARRDAERTHILSGRSVEEYRKGEYWAQRAAAAAADTSIRSEDPDAAAKLEAKIAGLEARRERMKAINAAIRRGGAEALRAMQPPLLREEIRDLELNARYSGGARYPSYALANLGAEIRRCRERLSSLTT